MSVFFSSIHNLPFVRVEWIGGCKSSQKRALCTREPNDGSLIMEGRLHSHFNLLGDRGSLSFAIIRVCCFSMHTHPGPFRRLRAPTLERDLEHRLD